MVSFLTGICLLVVALCGYDFFDSKSYSLNREAGRVAGMFFVLGVIAIGLLLPFKIKFELSCAALIWAFGGLLISVLDFVSPDPGQINLSFLIFYGLTVVLLLTNLTLHYEDRESARKLNKN